MRLKIDVSKLGLSEPSKLNSLSDAEGFSVTITDISQIGVSIKHFRKKNKINQQDVATFANVSRLKISELENGKFDIKLSTLLKILKVCNLRLEIRGLV